MPTAFQVFEHETIRIGEQRRGIVFTQKHFNGLAAFQEKAQKYYKLVHQGIRFTHYVGALQINDLIIEILPKADKKETADRQVWHGVLLDMLQYCRLIKVENLTAAHLRLRSNSILELYYDLFLQEVESLLREGLVKTYRRKEGQQTTLKGRLLLSKQISTNLLHRERFYTNYQTYDYDHSLNRMILAALHVLGKLAQVPQLLERQRQLLRYFPDLSIQQFTPADFAAIQYDRHTLRYQDAINIARLLLLNYSPDIRSGQHQLLAILFDMNVLFEEYVYQQLKRLRVTDFSVQRQQQTPFWNRRMLRPDLVINYQGKRMVLDTKWKILQKVSPEISDLKQMFIYNRYFASSYGVLLYPQVHQLKDLAPTPYESTVVGALNYCQICFVAVVKNGTLNRKLGIEIVEKLTNFKRK